MDYLRLLGPQAEPRDGIADLLLEVGSDRLVTREIGLDPSARVVHRMPSVKHRFGTRGFWDLMPVPEGEFTSITRDEFEAVWQRSAVEPPIEHRVHPGLREQLRRVRYPRSR